MTGLVVLPLPTIPGFVEARLPAALKNRQEEEARELAALAEQQFRARADKIGGDHDWHSAIGHVPNVLSLVRGHACFADLVIVGHTPESFPSGVAAASVPKEVMLSRGGPMLFVPAGTRTAEFGRRILVGWNGSREAVRAVHDALPFLRKAEEVTLLTVETSDTSDGRSYGGDKMLRHLAHHGIEAKARRSMVNSGNVGDVILSRAADARADLIVMGAYGHSRLREFVLGGATRRVLSQAKIQVLMSH